MSDNANLKLNCPHRTRHGKCNTEWDLNAILEVLRHEHLHETDESLSSPRKNVERCGKIRIISIKKYY